MQLRHVSFDQTEQILGLHEYLITRCEVFLDFDPVPYQEDEVVEGWERTRALNTIASGG